MIKKFKQFLYENKNCSDKEYQKWSDIVWDFMSSKNLEQDSVEGYQKLFDYLMKQQNLGNKDIFGPVEYEKLDKKPLNAVEF